MTVKEKAYKPGIWTDRVKQSWNLPNDMTVSQWSDTHRVLGTSSAASGQWRTDFAPYQRGIMDAFTDPLVEEITLMLPAQYGKTEPMINMLAYTIDQDPGPAMWVHPDQGDATEFCKERLMPMVDNTPQIKRHITRNHDDITKRGIKFDHMQLTIAWSTSPGRLKSRPIRYLFLDETDVYPPFSGREADPIKMSMERTMTFWNRKIVKSSSPTTKMGYIFREYERSDQRQFYIPCPHCGHYQVLVFRPQLKWPKEERDPDIIRQNKLAWYECISCLGKILDGMKHKMLLKGIWVPRGCHLDKKGNMIGDIKMNAHRGFWGNRLYSPWTSFSEVAAEFIESAQHPELLMNFVNAWLAEPWEENLGKTNPEHLKTLILPNPKGVVPDGAFVLTAGVDVQKDHFILTIDAWGYKSESWRILATRLETWEELLELVVETGYVSATDNTDILKVRMACVDTGYRTDEVYDVCRRFKDVLRPIKGKQMLRGVPFSVSNLDKFPANGLAIPGGLQLWNLDTTYFKDKISRLVRGSLEDLPGKWHLYQDILPEYLVQFCGEHKVILRDRRTGRSREEWRPVTSSARSDYFDAEVYATAAAEMLRVFSLQQTDAGPVRKVYRQPKTGGNKWIGETKNWIR